MNRTQMEVGIGYCAEIKKNGQRCKHIVKGRQKFCWHHRFNRRTDARWYHNSVIQCVAGILATIVFGWYFFLRGPTLENQQKLLSGQETVLRGQNEIKGVIVKGLSKSDETKEAWTVDFRAGNVALCRLDGSLSGHMALLLYDITIGNNCNTPTTLKDMVLLYKHNRLDQEALDSELMPTTFISPKAPNVLYLRSRSKNPNLFIMGWGNIRDVINKMEVKPPFATWRGSAVFVFPPIIQSPEDISDLRIQVQDYFSRRVEVSLLHDINNDPMWRAGAILHYGKFHTGEDGAVVLDY